MKAHKEQRVGVFVDVQNLYYSARYTYDRRVNFAAVLKDAVKGRQLVRAIAYVIKAEQMGESSFFDALDQMGYEVKAKDLQIFPGGAKKGDWDIGIAMDTIELAPKLDVIILVSGDGDYKDLVQHLKRALGCRVEAMAFGKSTSGLLLSEVDEFTDLDKSPDKYMMKRIVREKRTEPSAEDSAAAQLSREVRTRREPKTTTRALPPRLSAKRETIRGDELG
ncbi:NYN domain-containing protein [Candidatus Woesearchaeota archaeon]|nr:NYN domain-containing protein [Candidatus Woesearchaeota archaeon]